MIQLPCGRRKVRCGIVQRSDGFVLKDYFIVSNAICKTNQTLIYNPFLPLRSMKAR